MAFIGNFIGVNEHLDPGIRRLSGCKRDALALYSLFVDTLPGMQARLLLDADATLDHIRQAISETLGAATADDFVVLSFSGHGSKNHHVIAFDTQTTNLTATSLSMQEIAEAFRHSKAKAILCILDCCFSGNAPARVIEDSSTMRDIDDPYSILVQGKGRYLIAACSPVEVAYEDSSARQGYLTKAIIDVFSEGIGQIDLPVATSEILKHVRAETAKRGLIQTPTFLGHVEGGITIPVLKKGDQFYKSFPELKGTKIGKNIFDLALFGIPTSALELWNGIFKDGLNQLQVDTVNEIRILDGESALVVAPTSSGKTFIGEMAAVRAMGEGRKAVFLFPYKALVNEKFEQFSSSYGNSLGTRVIRCTGDYTDQTADLLQGKYDLAILTYEMFLSLVTGNPSILNQIGLVVLDEAQFITDPLRGINVELILTFLLTAREKGLNPQLIALSAVIGDANNFDAWLGLKALITKERPVPLIEGVIDRSGTFQFLDESGNEKTEQLISPRDIHQRGQKPSAQDMIVPLVRKLVSSGEKVIVFRNQRGKAQGCAKYLARDIALAPEENYIKQLPIHDSTKTSQDLKECFLGGTAFHNANLMREEREVVERAFRDPNGGIRMLAATTTVAAGINTPASTVIIAEQEFIGEDGRKFTVAEYKNMAGRAGRLGFNEKGRSIIYAEHSAQRNQLFQRYVRGDIESLRSSFDQRDVNTWVVRLLAQAKKVKRDDVPTLLCNTYGGYLTVRSNPDWRKSLTLNLQALMDRMLKLGLLEQDGDYVQLTLLGQACGESSLSFESALRFVEFLKQHSNLLQSPENLIAVVQILEEMDTTYTPVFKKGAKESTRASQAARYFGGDIVRLLQSHSGKVFVYYARCKRAAILAEWIRGVPLEQIEANYSTTPYAGSIQHGDVRRFADTTRFHLRSTIKILTILFPELSHMAESLDRLQKRLEVGIPEECLALLELPVPMGRGEYLALFTAGVNGTQSFWTQDPISIASLLSQERVTNLNRYRPESGSSN